MIRTDRPRLLLTPAIVADLKARAVPTNDRWTGLQSLCDRNPASWDVGIMNYCLAYVVTGNTAYSTKAWTLMLQSMAAGVAQASNPGHKPTMGAPTFMLPTGVHEVDGDSGYQARNYFLAACLLYDWCYPALNATQRNQLRADIEACADWVWPETNPSRKGQWGVDNPGNNYFYGFLCTMLVGLALSGDSGKAQGYVDNALSKWSSGALPYITGPAAGGYFVEGTSYGVDSWRLIGLITYAYSTAAGLTAPFWGQSPEVNALLHLTTPTLDRLYPGGDQTKSSSGALQDAPRTIMLIAASRGDTRARLWLDQSVPNRNQQRVNSWEEYLWYPGTPPVPAMAASSTFYSAPGSGLVSSRSDWTKDATQLLFQCGPTLESHQDRAIGEFLIFRGDWLAAMAKLRTASGLSQDPIAHNVVTFGTLSQSWTQDTAKLIIQENVEGSYTYLVGDLTGAYAPGGVPTVGHYTRTVFFLKPNFVLIRDEFNLINLGNTPVFHLHTLDQPVVGITGFAATSAAAGTKLFGTAAVMCPPAVPLKATPDQFPTWRMDFPADTTGGFCVALEAAPVNQGTTKVTMFTPPGLRGAVLGSDMAAVVTGDLPVTYKSPAMGVHYLLGLKPSTTYQINGSTLAPSSPAGVIILSNALVGTMITISEGNVNPPPVLTVTGYSANPVVAGTDFQINGTGFTSAPFVAWGSQSLIATRISDALISAVAPAVAVAASNPVTVSINANLVRGPSLTVNPIPIPPPVGRKFELLIAPDGTPAIGKEITS